jgi:gas vesicle protein
MSDNGFDRDSFFKGFLIGGVVGALAALLFAPKSGKELRGDIIRKGEEAVEGSKRIYNDAKSKAQAIISDAVEKAKSLKEEAAEHLATARQKAEALLANAETRVDALSESAKNYIAETREDAAKKKDKLSSVIGAGIQAAKQELKK